MPPCRRAIGHGNIALDSLLQGGGTSEVQVPIKSKAGTSGGWVLLAVQVALGDQTYQGDLKTAHMVVTGGAATQQCQRLHWACLERHPDLMLHASWCVDGTVTANDLSVNYINMASKPTSRCAVGSLQGATNRDCSHSMAPVVLRELLY